MNTGRKQWKYCTNRQCSTYAIRVRVAVDDCIACGDGLDLLVVADPLTDPFAGITPDPDVMAAFFGGPKR